VRTVDERNGTAAGLARQAAGRLQSRHVFVRERIGNLAGGDVVMEPALGLVRAGAIQRAVGKPFVRVHWRDDHGPCTAAARYPLDTVLLVRSPAPADRLLVGHGIDRATYLGREVDSRTARLIAAHLHRWPESALDRFAISGKLRGRVWGELEQVRRSCRPFLRPWVEALAGYCRAWRPGRLVLEELAEAPAPAAKPPTTTPDNQRRSTQARFPELMARKTVRSELALELIDAAFALGLTAGTSRTYARRVAAGSGWRD
jgi:hypothetical protein